MLKTHNFIILSLPISSWMENSLLMSHVYLSQRVNISAVGYWWTIDGLPPPNIPACGLRNEFCQSDPDDTCKN